MRFWKGVVTLGIVLLLVVGAMVWAWREGRDSGQRAKSVPQADASVQAGELAPNTSSSLTDGGQQQPLPPLDTPVSAMFDVLKRRADSGDAIASCRLAVELIECRQVAHFAETEAMQNAATEERDLAKAGMATAANRVAAMQLQQLESTNRCAGISESQRKLAGTYLAQAARAGVGEAMIRYADGQGFGTENSMFGMLRDPGLDQWRRDAPRFLHKALENGEPSAAVMLMSAHSDDNSLIGGLIADDPVQFYSYRALMDRLRGKPPSPRTDLTPTQTAEALARSARMHADYFKNAILTDPDAFRSPLMPAWTRLDGAAPPKPCE